MYRRYINRHIYLSIYLYIYLCSGSQKFCLPKVFWQYFLNDWKSVTKMLHFTRPIVCLCLREIAKFIQVSLTAISLQQRAASPRYNAIQYNKIIL